MAAVIERLVTDGWQGGCRGANAAANALVLFTERPGPLNPWEAMVT
jgi:hypothetical protein